MVDTRAPLMSMQQLADHLGVPLQTVRIWRVKGTGPRGIRCGRYVRYDPDDVAEWLNSRKDD